jgi:hypothetical protein
MNVKSSAGMPAKLVADVTFVWNEDIETSLPTAFYKGIRIVPSYVGVAPSEPYLLRSNLPQVSSIEKCDLILNSTKRSYIAYPKSFEGNAPGITKPVLLKWKNNGNIISTIEVTESNRRFTVYKGADSQKKHLGTRKASRWMKHIPADGEENLCWISWSLTPNGYPVGHAYRTDRRTRIFRSRYPR